MPAAQIWNFTVEKRLTNSVILEADYMGSHGYNLYVQTNVNRYAGDLVQHSGTLTRLNPNFGVITYGRITATLTRTTVRFLSVSDSPGVTQLKESTPLVKEPISRRATPTSRYNRPMLPIHPEGEDDKADPIETLVCPHCRNKVSVPKLANVDVFVCPDCGGRIPMPRRMELRP